MTLEAAKKIVDQFLAKHDDAEVYLRIYPKQKRSAWNISAAKGFISSAIWLSSGESISVVDNIHTYLAQKLYF